jgi:hypothetical protein
LEKLTVGSALPEGFRNVDLHAVGNLYLEPYAVNAHDDDNNDGIIIIIIIIINIACKILGLVIPSGPINSGEVF